MPPTRNKHRKSTTEDMCRWIVERHGLDALPRYRADGWFSENVGREVHHFWKKRVIAGAVIALVAWGIARFLQG